MFSVLFYEVVNDGETVYRLSSIGYAVLIVISLALLLAALAKSSKGLKGPKATRQLVFSAAAMALALITSGIRLFRMPMGGSVTPCSMLFIVLIGYWYGPWAGILTGFSHGILQLLMDPTVYSLAQMLTDYPLAFAALGLSGVFSEKKYGLEKGYILGVFGRCCFSVLSGCLFFADYAPEGMNPFWYSFTYNASFIGAEAGLTLLLLAIPAMRKAMAAIKRLALADAEGVYYGK